MRQVDLGGGGRAKCLCSGVREKHAQRLRSPAAAVTATEVQSSTDGHRQMATDRHPPGTRTRWTRWPLRCPPRHPACSPRPARAPVTEDSKHRQLKCRVFQDMCCAINQRRQSGARMEPCACRMQMSSAAAHTLSPGRIVPDTMRPNASKREQSCGGEPKGGWQHRQGQQPCTSAA